MPPAVRSAESLPDHVGVSQITAEGDDASISELSFEFRQSFGQRRLASAGDTDAAAFAQKRRGNCFANATRGAGNQGNTIL
jgi:hypothetical protein